MIPDHPSFLRRDRRLRSRMLTTLAISAWLLLQAPCLAFGSDWAAVYRLTVQGFDWQPSYSVLANGIPVHVRDFRSTSDATETARRLSVAGSMFQAIVAVPGLIRMSGLQGRNHWLAEITEDKRGTARGRVSMIRVDAEARTGRDALEDDLLAAVHAVHEQSGGQAAFPWLPKHARQLLEHRGTADDPGAPVRSVYAVALDAAHVHSHIAAALTRHGWAPQATAGDSDSLRTWLRDGRRLTVLVQDALPETIVYISMER